MKEYLKLMESLATKSVGEISNNVLSTKVNNILKAFKDINDIDLLQESYVNLVGFAVRDYETGLVSKRDIDTIISYGRQMTESIENLVHTFQLNEQTVSNLVRKDLISKFKIKKIASIPSSMYNAINHDISIKGETYTASKLLVKYPIKEQNVYAEQQDSKDMSVVSLNNKKYLLVNESLGKDISLLEVIDDEDEYMDDEYMDDETAADEFASNAEGDFDVDEYIDNDIVQTDVDQKQNQMNNLRAAMAKRQAKKASNLDAFSVPDEDTLGGNFNLSTNVERDNDSNESLVREIQDVADPQEIDNYLRNNDPESLIQHLEIQGIDVTAEQLANMFDEGLFDESVGFEDDLGKSTPDMISEDTPGTFSNPALETIVNGQEPEKLPDPEIQELISSDNIDELSSYILGEYGIPVTPDDIELIKQSNSQEALAQQSYIPESASGTFSNPALETIVNGQEPETLPDSEIQEMINSGNVDGLSSYILGEYGIPVTPEDIELIKQVNSPEAIGNQPYIPESVDDLTQNDDGPVDGDVDQKDQPVKSKALNETEFEDEKLEDLEKEVNNSEEVIEESAKKDKKSKKAKTAEKTDSLEYVKNDLEKKTDKNTDNDDKNIEKNKKETKEKGIKKDGEKIDHLTYKYGEHDKVPFTQDCVDMCENYNGFTVGDKVGVEGDRRTFILESIVPKTKDFKLVFENMTMTVHGDSPKLDLREDAQIIAERFQSKLKSTRLLWENEIDEDEDVYDDEDKLTNDQGNPFNSIEDEEIADYDESLGQDNASEIYAYIKDNGLNQTTDVENLISTLSREFGNDVEQLRDIANDAVANEVEIDQKYNYGKDEFDGQMEIEQDSQIMSGYEEVMANEGEFEAELPIQPGGQEAGVISIEEIPNLTDDSSYATSSDYEASIDYELSTQEAPNQPQSVGIEDDYETPIDATEGSRFGNEQEGASKWLDKLYNRYEM